MQGGGGDKERRVSGRDVAVLEFVARFGVVPRSAMAKWAGTAKTVTSEREKRLRDAGLLEVTRPWLGPEPVLVATAEGLAVCGREELVKAKVSPRTLRHFAVAAHLAVELERAGEQLLSERELLAHERAMGERDFSIRLRGEEKYHRPDMIILPAAVPPASDLGRQGPSSSRTQGGRRSERTNVCERADRTEDAEMRSVPGVSKPIAVEVELTAKAKTRLDEILTGWKTAVERGRFARIRYYCSSEALPYVKRSVERADAGEEVTVEALPDEDLFATSIYA